MSGPVHVSVALDEAMRLIEEKVSDHDGREEGKNNQ